VGQTEPTEHNLARWDGRTWHLETVAVEDLGGIVGPFPLECVFAFSQNDVWVSGYANLIHWDGQGWTWKALFIKDLSFNGQVLTMWGTDDNNIYLGGRNGAIYHFTGSNWTKLQTVTTLDITGIWGATDAATGATEILAVASQDAVSLDRAILKIDGTSVQAIADSGIYQPINGVWFKPNEQYYVVGSGIYEKKSLADPLWHSYGYTITHYYTTTIRGTDVNDVWASGAYGEIVHFNGARWQSFQSVTWLDNGAYPGLAVKGNLVIAVGGLNPVAIIAIGRRATFNH
jgi:hypothetical protein